MEPLVGNQPKMEFHCFPPYPSIVNDSYIGRSKNTKSSKNNSISLNIYEKKRFIFPPPPISPLF